MFQRRSRALHPLKPNRLITPGNSSIHAFKPDAIKAARELAIFDYSRFSVLLSLPDPSLEVKIGRRVMYGSKGSMGAQGLPPCQ